MTRKNAYSFLLLLGALIWGGAFVAQSVGMDYVGPFTFLWARSVLSSLALLPVIWFINRKSGSRTALLPLRKDPKLALGGFLCGFFLFWASYLQQAGLQYTTAGKAGFITAFYVALVPVFCVFLYKRRYSPLTWLGVVLAVAGLYFLGMNEKFSIQCGDLLVFLCSVVFACQILSVDKYAAFTDCVRLSCVQFIVCSLLSFFGMLFFEHPTAKSLLSAALPILYAGLLSGAVAYTLQVVGQKYVEPAVASLIMSFESVFAALFGWVILREALSLRELAGCVLTFAAVLLVELAPDPRERKREDA